MNAPIVPQQIEYWPLARLKPYTRNAKTHDADQVVRHHAWCVGQLIYCGNVIRASAD